jgi:putative transposase
MWWARSLLLFVAKRKGRTKIDRHEMDSRILGRALDIRTENGMDGMEKARDLVFNTAMKIERGEFLKAGPFERSDERIGPANGFKPRRLQTRAGALGLAIPRVRGLDDGEPGFHPRSLERGVSGERELGCGAPRCTCSACRLAM